MRRSPFVWVRTQMNSPAAAPLVHRHGRRQRRRPDGQRPRRRQPDEDRGPSLALEGIQRLSCERIAGIASKADVSPIEFADRQSILLTNPGLNGRLQVTNTIRCAISIYNPGDIAPAHVHSPNASRTILSDKGGYTNVEGERCDAARGDIILTPNGTWHDHGNDGERAGDLDRHAGLAADGVSGLRLGRPGFQARLRQQRQEPGDRAQERLFQPALRQRRHGADLRLAPARLRPRSRLR